MRGFKAWRRPSWAGAIAFILLFLGPAAGSAGDLLSVYETALDQDPTLAGERYALEASRERVPAARSALLPALGANAQLGRTGGNVTYTDTPTVNRAFSSFGWTFQLSLPLLHAGSLVTYQQSHRAADQAQAQYELARQSLILRVAQAYFDVLAAQDDLSAADAQVQASVEQRAIAQSSYQKGVASVTDVDEATSRWQSAVSEQLAAQNAIQTKEADLEEIIGPLPATLARLPSGILLTPPSPADEGQWTAEAMQSSPNVVALKAAVEVAKLDVERARYQRLPTVDAVAAYGRNYSSGNNNNPIDYATNAHIIQGGIQFSMPLIDGGGIHALIGEAEARERKAQADLEAARRQAGGDARTAYGAVVSGIAQMAALQSALDASVSAAKGNQAGYRLGIRINSDVLDSLRQRFTAERDLARTRYDTLIQGLKLKAAAGMLQSADVVTMNAMLVEERAP